jgi:hypothetical protein
VPLHYPLHSLFGVPCGYCPHFNRLKVCPPYFLRHGTFVGTQRRDRTDLNPLCKSGAFTEIASRVLFGVQSGSRTQLSTVNSRLHFHNRYLDVLVGPVGLEPTLFSF